MIGLAFGGLRDLFRDLFRALEVLLEPGARASRLIPAILSLAVAWVLYVPLHELLHAAGCLATGGAVSELRLSPLYGGRILEGRIPFVKVAGAGEHAGRLTGFDTRGSDLVYLATDFAAYLPAILIGAPLLRRLGRSPAPAGAPWLFGPAVVIGASPLIGLAGDYFEMGTVLATRVPGWTGLTHLRSDDLFALVADVGSGRLEAGVSGVILIAASLLLAVILASWTCRIGTVFASVVIERGAAAVPP